MPFIEDELDGLDPVHGVQCATCKQFVVDRGDGGIHSCWDEEDRLRQEELEEVAAKVEFDVALALMRKYRAFTLDTIAPGVTGYVTEHDGANYVGFIQAITPGGGDVSRYLDSLDPARTWKFPCVLSPRLRGMLVRRGFTVVVESTDDDAVDVYVREATARSDSSSPPAIP